MELTHPVYKVELHPGSDLHALFLKLWTDQDLLDWFDEREWMLKQGVEICSKWVNNTHYISVLLFESEATWWEFRLRWL